MANTRFDLHHAVLDAMAAAGCAPMKPEAIVFDGRLHRYDVAGDRRGRQNGWFVLHDTIIPFGAFGSWKTGVTQGWSGGDVEALPPEQRERQRRQMAEIAAQRAAEERRRQAQARERAERLWARANPTVSDRHPYLRNKQVPALGLRQLRELLLVPVHDGDGTLRSLEFLNPEGGKKFLKGGAVTEGRHWLGDPRGARTLLICEGYATGASLHQACGLPVAVAFSRGNVFPVAKDLHHRFPGVALVIAGDDDRYTPGNPGRRDAEEAARWVAGTAIFPDFTGLETARQPTDFNDVHLLGGLDHLKRQLETLLAAVPLAEVPRAEPSTRPADLGRRAEARAVPVLEMAAPRRRQKPRGDGGRPNPYQEVTDRIIEMIETGTAPWQRPWDRPRHLGVPAFPVNAATGNAYRGINVLLLGGDPRLADDPRWCGYQQAQARGWHVQAGARGTPIYFFKRIEVADGSEADEELRVDADDSSLRRTIPLLCRHTVFHASQIEGIPSLEAVYGSMAGLLDHVWDTEERLERLLRGSGARFVHAGTRAYYDPLEDTITLPPRARFRDAAAFFGVAFHELGHWTGHATRLNRPLTGQRDSPAYAREELRAELASAFLGAELGIAHDLEPHAAYLDGYLELLRNDNREIFRAARDAQGIAELILDRHPTWRLQDGVCVARTEPVPDDEADAHRHPVIAAPTATDTPTAPSLAAPYRWAFAAVRDSDAIPADSPLGRLSRRVDDALPLSAPLRAAAVPVLAPTSAPSRRPDEPSMGAGPRP
ncbi:zincin-like metallopeptidase domain-containing protein [Candidatus Competibacter phosphatis]|nr:zincin-like metallopeptidase domain-containing protein [Candidatus Competibacter phosphatis]